MAELLGIVASSIAVAEVAAKAGSAIPKLKALWDEVQNVPETIQHLLKQIEILDPMVWEMENELNSHRTTVINPVLFNDDVMRRSTQYCRESLQSLTDIVDDMSVQVHNAKKFKRGLAKVKVILKKKTLTDLETRLRNALTLLSFAQQSYIMSMMKLQPHIIIGKLTSVQQCQSLERIPLGVEDGQLAEKQGSFDVVSGVAQETALGLMYRQRPERSVDRRSFGNETVIWRVSERKFPGYHTTSYSLRLQLPTWLLRTSWEIQVSRGLGGPSAGLRAWRVVQRDTSPAFRAIESGDVQALVQSLEKRQSTLFDREPDGTTLLHKAAELLEFDCLRYLQTCGLSVNETDNRAQTPFVRFGWRRELNCIGLYDTRIAWDADRLSEWNQVLLSSDAVGDPSHLWFGYVGATLCTHNDEGFDLLLRVWNFPEYSAFQMIQLYLFVICSWHHRRVRPDIYAFAFRKMKIQRDLLQDGIVGDISFVIGSSSWPLSEHEADDWGKCLAMLLSADEFDHTWLHSTAVSLKLDVFPAHGKNTPLSYLLQGYCYRHYGEQGKRRHSRLISVLHFWLHLLQRNQVDLMAYGLQERQLVRERHPEIGMFRQPTIDEYFDVYLFPSGVPERLLDIKYGPDPRDWELIWDLDIERMAGDFWASLNEPEFPMPGQWVEE